MKKHAKPRGKPAVLDEEPAVVRGEVIQSQRPRCWESFFRCQPSPIFRSQLLAGLMAGTKLEVARIPTVTLLDAVLLATAARAHCEAEIVDDYQQLLDRTNDAWRAPDWTTKVFSSIHGGKANFILTQGRQEFVSAEDAYIPEMVEWYLNQDAPRYFERELETDADLRKWRKAA